ERRCHRTLSGSLVHQAIDRNDRIDIAASLEGRIGALIRINDLTCSPGDSLEHSGAAGPRYRFNPGETPVRKAAAEGVRDHELQGVRPGENRATGSLKSGALAVPTGLR